MSDHENGFAPPDGTRVYAVGDIHGARALLEEIQALIAADLARRRPARAVVVYLGDYVDRGPDSRGVIDRLIDAPVAGAEPVHLRGNHEALLLDFLDAPAAGRLWLANGGMATLRGYGVAPPAAGDAAALAAARDALRRAIPPRHRAFLEALPARHVEGGYCFAPRRHPAGPRHRRPGGVRPAVDPRRFPGLARRSRPARRARPHDRPPARNPRQPDRHRHRGRPHRHADLRGAGGDRPALAAHLNAAGPARAELTESAAPPTNPPMNGPTPSETGKNFDRLKTLLREMFQLDRGDLDFGLYRIMNMKAGEIGTFLDRDLLPQVKTVLAGVADEERARTEAALADSDSV